MDEDRSTPAASSPPSSGPEPLDDRREKLAQRIASPGPAQRKLLERLREGGKAAARGTAPMPRRPPAGPCPLSFGQQRLWFLAQVDPGSAAYNIPFTARLAGDLDAPALERALGELVRRHESLRTRFVAEEDGRPAQVIDPPPPLPLRRIDLAGPATGWASTTTSSSSGATPSSGSR